MKWLLVDAIGPFFRGYEKARINWSKIPFPHLRTEGPERRAQWDRIREDLRLFARRVCEMGYNSVTLDDLAHLAPHPLHEPEVAARIAVFREEFAVLFRILREEFDLKVFLTTDVLPMSPAVADALGDDVETLERYYLSLVTRVLDDFPQLEGLVLRIGESDGNDVKDPVRTRLHLRSAASANHLLKRLLPEFERRGRTLIFRTWTVGAYKIGDLIWHRQTLAETLEGISSPAFVLSMKHGESDFFRYLPLNSAIFRTTLPVILELQARREYEGAGEYPSYIGRDCERFARELEGAGNLVGISVWCQTGGWHRFRRLAFLEEDGSDIWIRINAAVAIAVLGRGESADQALREWLGPARAAAAIPLLDHADEVVRKVLYIEDFARLKLFFRRVRIPPLLHVYWDSLFVNHAVRKVLRHFVPDGESALRGGEEAALRFPEMIRLAREAELPTADIEHMRDFFSVLLLARRYYFLPFDEALAERLRAAKRCYKKRWPKTLRQRFRIKLSFTPFRVKRRTLAWVSGLLLRRRRAYRLLDHIFTLHLLGLAYRAFRPRDPKALPKFLRKSAMGVETLFK